MPGKHLCGIETTPEERERILSLYREGNSYKTVATTVGRHWQTVGKVVREAGIQRASGDAIRQSPLQVSREFLARIGKIGGKKTKERIGSTGYQEIGRKGGATVRRYVLRGREIESSNSAP